MPRKPVPTDESVVELTNQYMSDSEISKILGTSKSTIRRIRARLGISYTMKQVSNRPGYKAKQVAKNSDPTYLQRQSDIQKAAYTPEKCAEHSILIKNVWQRPGYIDKQHAAWATEDKRKAQSELQKNIQAARVKEAASLDDLAAAYPALALEYSVVNKLPMSDYTYGSKYKAHWECANGHEWQAAIKDRTRYNGSNCPNCAGISSNEEEFIYDFVKQFKPDVERNVRGLLKENSALEIDIYVPSLRLGIEYCGEYWHREGAANSSVIPNYGQERHRLKWQYAKNAGIRLITIFASEVKNRLNAVEGYLLSVLGVKKNTIYARECVIKVISQEESISFLDEYHIQGGCSSVYQYGLFYEGVLLAVMAFTRRKTVEYELARFCVTNHTSIPGAASKLLKYFERNVYYTKLVSFSDNRYSAGNLYNKIGFLEAGTNKPSYYYFKLGRHELQHKFKFRKDAIESKLGKLLPGETEYQAMLRFGYDRIWDCGKIKWERSPI